MTLDLNIFFFFFCKESHWDFYIEYPPPKKKPQPWSVLVDNQWQEMNMVVADCQICLVVLEFVLKLVKKIQAVTNKKNSVFTWSYSPTNKNNVFMTSSSATLIC